MSRVLFISAILAALSACPCIAQTADHAPTKPAADAAARFDRSREQGATDSGDQSRQGSSRPAAETSAPSPGGTTAGHEGDTASSPKGDDPAKQ